MTFLVATYAISVQLKSCRQGNHSVAQSNPTLLVRMVQLHLSITTYKSMEAEAHIPCTILARQTVNDTCDFSTCSEASPTVCWMDTIFSK